MVFTPAALQPGKKEETGVGYTELEKALWVLCSILLLLLTFFFLPFQHTCENKFSCACCFIAYVSLELQFTPCDINVSVYMK